jgi:hypothetical protein
METKFWSWQLKLSWELHLKSGCLPKPRWPPSKIDFKEAKEYQNIIYTSYIQVCFITYVTSILSQLLVYGTRTWEPGHVLGNLYLNRSLVWNPYLGPWTRTRELWIWPILIYLLRFPSTTLKCGSISMGLTIPNKKVSFWTWCHTSFQTESSKSVLPNILIKQSP